MRPDGYSGQMTRRRYLVLPTLASIAALALVHQLWLALGVLEVIPTHQGPRSDPWQLVLMSGAGSEMRTPQC